MEDDIDRVLVDEQVIHKRLDVMAKEVRKDFPGEVLVVIVLVVSLGMNRFVERRYRQVFE